MAAEDTPREQGNRNETGGRTDPRYEGERLEELIDVRNEEDFRETEREAVTEKRQAQPDTGATVFAKRRLKQVDSYTDIGNSSKKYDQRARFLC